MEFASEDAAEFQPENLPPFTTCRCARAHIHIAVYTSRENYNVVCGGSNGSRGTNCWESLSVKKKKKKEGYIFDLTWMNIKDDNFSPIFRLNRRNFFQRPFHVYFRLNGSMILFDNVAVWPNLFPS